MDIKEIIILFIGICSALVNVIFYELMKIEVNKERNLNNQIPPLYNDPRVLWEYKKFTKLKYGKTGILFWFSLGTLLVFILSLISLIKI